MKRNTARVITTLKCSRDCHYCVNKQRGYAVKWNAHPLTDILELLNFDMILLTGGEPLRFYDRLISLLIEIRAHEEDIPIILYATRNLISTEQWLRLFQFIDGVTWTIHHNEGMDTLTRDMDDFHKIQELGLLYPSRSFRLNLAPTISMSIPIVPKVWDEIKIKEWVDDCPTPDNETLFILPEAKE